MTLSPWRLRVLQQLSMAVFLSQSLASQSISHSLFLSEPNHNCHLSFFSQYLNSTFCLSNFFFLEMNISKTKRESLSTDGCSILQRLSWESERWDERGWERRKEREMREDEKERENLKSATLEQFSFFSPLKNNFFSLFPVKIIIIELVFWGRFKGQRCCTMTKGRGFELGSY